MKKIAKLVASTLTLAMLMGPAAVYAAEAPDFDLEQLVVTATKNERPLDKITQKVTVIDKKEMDKIVSGNRNLAELLMYQPGVAVNALSRNDANWGSYGGLGPKYNTYMLDGIPFDSFADSMNIDSSALEQVESQRGPASVLYSNYLSSDFNGNQTPLAGTTNFRLKDKVDKNMTKVTIGAGSYSTKNMKLYSQGTNGAWNYLVGGSFEKSDYTNYGTNPSWLNMLDKPQYDKTKVYFKTTYFINPDKSMSLFVNHADHNGDTGRVNRDYDHNYDVINFAYKNKVNEKLNSEFKVGYRDTHRRWGEDNYPANLSLKEHDGVKQQIMPMDLTFTLKNNENSVLTFGMDYQKAKYQTYAENPAYTINNRTNSENYGLFVQQESFQGPWTFRIGGRYNNLKNNFELFDGKAPGESSKSWDKFLWSVGTRYAQNDKVSWYANAGTSFVAPGAKQVGGTLKITDEGVAGKNGQIPNPSLKPESGTAYDLGVDYKVNNNTNLGLRTFYTQVKDTIIDQPVSGLPAGTSQSKAKNVGKTTSKGMELEVKQKLSEGLSWFTNYTYTNAKIKNPGQADDGSTVPFVPENMYNMGVVWEKPNDYSLAVYNHYNGGIYDGPSKKFDSYNVINANFQKQLKNDMKFNLDLYNLGDKKFEMPWQFQDPGFSYQASVEFQF